MSPDQLFQSLLEWPFITPGFLIEDHQIGRQSMHPPIGMSLEQLADQADIPRFTNSYQGYRQVARYAVRPQSGLALAILSKALAGSAQEGVGKQQVTGQLLKS